MSDHIDPVHTAAGIKSTYRRYLQSLLAVRDPKLDAALRKAIDTTPMLDKGPYLEATPPYAPGASAKDLIEEGVLAPGFAALASDVLPLDRPLYVHQEQSIRKVAAGRNVVVATGTGSGKTESFLLPILDSLVREADGGKLEPGVRALLLYPMNALANDQMKRLRQLLAGYSNITFGRYTGDTEQDPRAARDRFHELNLGEPMLPNELLSREEMRATPPHLLLTNYAMLEYLLLRPLDMDLFPASDNDKWRFLVVDEAHVYDGTQGAEVAMLLRRVRDRVAPSRPIQCIATSATVGGDTDPASVTQFASRLFGEQFEWSDSDPTRQDLIMARRVATPPGPYWGPLSASDYVKLASSLDPESDVLTAAKQGGFEANNAATALLHERSLVGLRSALASGPIAFGVLGTKIFGGDPKRNAGLASMVELASGLRADDGTTPLSARYHLFLRATEGAFACLSEQGPHVHLARHDTCSDCAAPVFEIGSCKRCGAVHVIGSLLSEDGVPRLRPRKQSQSNIWLVLGDPTAQVDEDEDAVAGDGGAIDGDAAKLCTACGAVCTADAAVCRAVGCGSRALRPVKRLKQRGEDIAGCLVCGARGAGTVRVFETGADASGAVITTSLYQNLPASDDPHDRERPGEGRKLLMFSDSRQAAAYFAPYLEDSYGRVQRRRLIAQGLLGSGADQAPVSISDLVFETRRNAADVKHFKRRTTAQEQMREVAPWVMAEVLATDDRQSLEGLGLVSIALDRDPAWRAPAPLLALGLTDHEAWAFIQELLRTLRQQGAVTMPDDVPPNHEIFDPRLGPIYARQTGPEAIKKVLSWLPGRGTNRRIDYTRKVLQALGSPLEPGTVLDGVWRFLTAGRDVDWLKTSTVRTLGTVHQIDHELLRLRWVTPETPAYRCTVCRRIAPHTVRGVCPALSCEGALEAFVPPGIEDERDHYRAVYRSMHPVPLSALEHTAQWTSTEAARIQQDFVRGEVNALSCSTTFELGVDVGELQAVMLRNMPPTTANYVQRAGRAGRRSGSAALVVTYAQRRSHDLTRYAQPEVMMSGSIRTPGVPLDNVRIDRRHAHSVALAAFFRWYFETTHRISRNAGDFFLPDDSGQDPPVTLVKGFLDPVPSAVSESLRRVIPTLVQTLIDIDGEAWVGVLVELLDQVRMELSDDVAVLEGLRDRAADAQNFRMAERYKQVGNTLRRRDLLGVLANRNVLPKYGFPVDSVELRTAYSYAEHQLGSRLDLSRDLSRAIYEYAPDATLVAGGQLWTSQGIYRLPGRALEEFRYYVCERCGGFRQAIAELDAQCPQCGEVAKKAPRLLTVPEFGFVAGRQPKRPGPRPPKRSWSGAVHVLKQSDESRERTLALGGGHVKASVGPRGSLVAIADGPSGMGFWVCDWCGYGAARMLHPRHLPAHDHLLKHTPCRGSGRLLDLAHAYETDLLMLDLQVPGFSVAQSTWKSVLYAVLEACCESLEIARDDIGGTLSPTGTASWSLVLFDAVPGGAGHVIMVEERLEQVLGAALKRVSECECGRETSCYGCLRSYSNQRDHDELSRGSAADLLLRLLGPGVRADLLEDGDRRASSRDLPMAWQELHESATPEEKVLIGHLAESGVPMPEVGHETISGIPLGISWPDRQVVADIGLEDEDRAALVEEGWMVVELNADSIREVLEN